MAGPAADAPTHETDGTPGLRVVELDARSDPRWEPFVRAHPDGLVYHHPAWLRALVVEYRREPLVLACEDESRALRGVLPLLRTPGLPLRRGGHITGRRLSSLPRTPIAGPLAADPQAFAALVRAAVARARQVPGTRLELKLSGEAGGVRNGDPVVQLPWNRTLVLDLPAPGDELRFGDGRNHRRVTWAVRKAGRNGLDVRPAETRADVRAWYRLYLETMRWHTMPARPYRFFEACWMLLRPRGLMRLLLAERHAQGAVKLIAGSVFFMSGRTCFYAFNGSDRSELSLHPNDAIQWRAIHDAWREGYRWYDFGEVRDDDVSLAQFKEKWGAEPRQLYRAYSPPPRRLEPDPLGRRGYVRRAAMAVWQHLPLTAVERLGDRFYAYL